MRKLGTALLCVTIFLVLVDWILIEAILELETRVTYIENGHGVVGGTNGNH